MSAKSGCLYLILVLVLAWTDDLKAGTFVAVSPTGSPVFGQEVYPIGRRHIAEMRDALEQLQFAPPREAVWVEIGRYDLPLTPLDETTPRIVRSCDLRYLLASLQR